MNLENKNILITGATSGIGQALAFLSAKKGANVILLAKNEKKLAGIYDELTNLNPKNHSICVFDLAKASQKEYENLLSGLQSEYEHLDIVFHNAAVLDKLCPIEIYEPYLWLHVMQVNVNASFLLTHYLFPLVKKAKEPHIWFMSSSVAAKPKANWGAYSASKAAQDALMQTLSDENKNMIVNSINPGATRTKMRAIAYPFENQDKLPTPIAKAESIIRLIETTQISGHVFNLNDL